MFKYILQSIQSTESRLNLENVFVQDLCISNAALFVN